MVSTSCPVPAADRARLEQLCRYLLRPPVDQDRLRLTSDGRFLLELKSLYAALCHLTGAATPFVRPPRVPSLLAAGGPPASAFRQSLDAVFIRAVDHMEGPAYSYRKVVGCSW